jgi:hypothetical protein
VSRKKKYRLRIADFGFWIEKHKMAIYEIEEGFRRTAHGFGNWNKAES